MSQRIAIGRTGTFYGFGANGQPGRGVPAEVIHVWSDTCVNVRTDQGHMPTSVPIPAPGQSCSGYFFVPDPVPAEAPAAAADTTEAAIVAAGADVAPRVTPADVEAAIASEHYGTAADFGDLVVIRPGSAERPTSLRLLTFCVLVLRNGFTVTGESACASPENFNAEIGRRIARENAVAKVWPLLGYALRDRLSAQADASASQVAHCLDDADLSHL